MLYRLTIHFLDHNLELVQEVIREVKSTDYSRAFSSAIVALLKGEDLPKYKYYRLYAAEHKQEDQWVLVQPTILEEKPSTKKSKKK